MIMALGRILRNRICNQEIGVSDRYSAAPHRMAERGEEIVCVGGRGLRSIRKRLPHQTLLSIF